MEAQLNYAAIRDADVTEKDFLTNNPCAMRMLIDARRGGGLLLTEVYMYQLTEDGFAEEDVDYSIQELIDRCILEVIYNSACHLTPELKQTVQDADPDFAKLPDEEKCEIRKIEKEEHEYQWEQAERGHFKMVLQEGKVCDPYSDPPPTKGHPLTDLGNAARFVEHWERDMKFCPETNNFFIWDYRCWSQDSSLRYQDRAQATIRSIIRETVIPTGESAKTLRKHAKRSQNATRISNTINPDFARGQEIDA